MNKENVNLYDIFLHYSYSYLKELFKKVRSKEEQDFYITLTDMLLQRGQK